MFLRYYLNAEGKRVYTLKMKTDAGIYTKNAHPGKSDCISQPAGRRSFGTNHKIRFSPNSEIQS